MRSALPPATRDLLRAAWLALVVLLTACGTDAGRAVGGEDAGGDAAAEGDAADALDAHTGLDGEPDAPTDPTDAGRDAPSEDAAPARDSGGDDGEDDDALEDVAPPPADDADAGGEDDAADSGGDVAATPERCPPGRPPTVYGDELAPGGGFRSHTFTRCAPQAHVAVLPRGSRWRFDAEGLPDDARLLAYDGSWFRMEGTAVGPRDLARSERSRDGATVWVTLEAPHAGEFVLLVDRDDLNRAGSYQLRVVCEAGCDRETTRFPTVFVHGYAGVDTYFGVLDYFFDVRNTIEPLGYDVHFPVMTAIATSERRAAQLAEQIDAILLENRARKVNLIAHSQGGLDARLLTSGLGYHDRVASITTVATPHRGIPLVLVDFVSAQDFSPEYMEVFNRLHPDHPDVRYWSWSARSCGALELSCRRGNGGEVVNALISAPYALLSRFGASDGIVPTASMPWAEHLGELSADHFDEVGQVAKRDRDDVPFNHRRFYLGEVRRLAEEGL